MQITLSQANFIVEEGMRRMEFAQRLQWHVQVSPDQAADSEDYERHVNKHADRNVTQFEKRMDFLHALYAVKREVMTANHTSGINDLESEISKLRTVLKDLPAVATKFNMGTQTTSPFEDVSTAFSDGAVTVLVSVMDEGMVEEIANIHDKATEQIDLLTNAIRGHRAITTIEISVAVADALIEGNLLQPKAA